MDKILKDDFVTCLIEAYGESKPLVSKFGSTSYGKIAEELCISNSQFSKLISGNATEGMYIRAIRNVKKIAEFNQLKEEVELFKSKQLDNPKTEEIVKLSNKNSFLKILLLAVILIGSFITGVILYRSQVETNQVDKHPLDHFFNVESEAPFQTAYTSNRHVQSFCPASAYEGKWILDKPYKLPLPGLNSPGLYYYAKSSDMRMKASLIEKDKGKKLLGLEVMEHEIWLDRTQSSMFPRYFDKTTHQYTEEFEKLDFSKASNFVLVAKIRSFFINEFTISKNHVDRKAQPSGRYVHYLNEEVLKSYKIDLNMVLNYVLTDFVSTKCEPSLETFCDPNELKEYQTTLSYNCFFTLQDENLGFGGGYPYTKVFKFVHQNYKDHLICNDCDSVTIEGR